MTASRIVTMADRIANRKLRACYHKHGITHMELGRRIGNGTNSTRAQVSFWSAGDYDYIGEKLEKLKTLYPTWETEHVTLQKNTYA
jgi:hypothetical protein